MHQRHKLPHNPSLINLRRIARMPLKDRKILIHMLKKLNKKSAAPSCSYGSKNKESWILNHLPHHLGRLEKLDSFA